MTGFMLCSKEFHDALLKKERLDVYILYKAAERASQTFVQTTPTRPIVEDMRADFYRTALR